MICKKCENDLPEEFFNYKNKKEKIKQSFCKECTSNYRKEYYNKNKEKAIEYSKKTTKDIRIRNRQFVWDYLKEHPCIECGEKNPVTLEFDHRDEKTKVMDISSAVDNGWSIKKISEEIKKCDVLCSNCHKVKTAEQFDWYKYIIK